MTKLTFAEFEELLKIVVVVPLDRIDPRLSVLINMNAGWFQGLMRVLTQRYRDEHRLFSSPDGNTQHLVSALIIQLTNDHTSSLSKVILNPNNLDMLLLVTMNSASGVQVYSVH